MSRAVDRLNEYENIDFDIIILKIKSGVIKCGRFSHLVKTKGSKPVPKKGVLFDVRSDASGPSSGEP